MRESLNDNRKEKNGERERERWYVPQLRAKLRRVKLLRLQSQRKHNYKHCQGEYTTTVFFLNYFLRKNEIWNYFYVMGWTSCKFKWLGILILIFCFWIGFLLNNLFICCCLA